MSGFGSYVPPGSQPRPEQRGSEPEPTVVPAADIEDEDEDEGDGCDTPHTTLDIALMLAARGLPVFPCSANKRPAIPEADGGHGCRDATTDPDQVRALFARAPHASLVGVAAGHVVDVLDIDPRHGGDIWEQQNRHRLPETLIHGTPGGGHHLVFHHHPGVRNSAGKIGPGVDVRGEGGYAIWPPSQGYQVIHDVEPAEWPAWLLEGIVKVEAPPRPVVRSDPVNISNARLEGLMRSLLLRLRHAPEGAKHGTLLAIARTIGGYARLFALSDDQLVALMLAALPDTVRNWQNAEKTARDGLAYGRAAPLELEERQPRPRQLPPYGPAKPGGDRTRRGNAARQLGAAFLRNPALRERWEGGTQGLNDTSPSGRDMSVVAFLVTEDFTKGEVRAALRSFGHGKLPEEEAAGTGDRYVDRIWAATKASLHIDQVPPDDWEEQHPPGGAIPDSEPSPASRRRRRQTPHITTPETVWDPWENPPPPQWPPGILPPQIEDALANMSLRDGVDHGALSMTAISAASAAAPKDARFVPYNTDWTVPAIIWLMTIGESGSRKTLLEEFGFCVIRAVQLELWRPHNVRMQEWRRLPPKERGPKPEEPHSYLLNDYTPEALQAVLARTTRGTAVVKDELAGFLEFDRYKRSGGSQARAFFLSAYEDKDCPVHRIGRDSEVVEHTGLTVFGNIQPRRLKAFQTDMETDGLLQRFVQLWVEPAKPTHPEVRIGPGIGILYDTIRSLCHLDGRRYTTTSDAAELILDTETLAREYATLTDFGLGWPGFCNKLHGTHARLALILHLMEAPDADVIPFDTVRRASRLVHHFILQHAHDFYAALPGRGHSLAHDIAGWLLTRGPADLAATESERILASDLTTSVRACRPLGSKAIGEVLDPFVTGGWLVPESDFPTNRAWFFNPAIRCRFAAQMQLAREERAEARALIARINRPRQLGPDDGS